MNTGAYASKRADRFTFFIVTAVFLAVCFLTLYLPELAAEGIKRGINSSLEVLLPSLFPFMFLAAFATNYGISQRLGGLFRPFTENVMNLPCEAGVTVLLSLVGGYPVGAIGIEALLKAKKITPKTAKRMILFCVNPGPAFMISAVGEGMFSSRLIGLIMFAAQVFSSLLLGAILGLLSRNKSEIALPSTTPTIKKSFSEAFVLSAHSACSSAVSLCSLVVLFSAFGSMLFGLISFDEASLAGAAFRAFFEVTDGCTALAGIRMPAYFTALAAGWGGLCVHFQVFAQLPDVNISKLRFALSRLTVGLLSGGITFLVMKYTNIGTAVFSNVENTHAELSSVTFIGSAALFISSAALLFFIGSPNERQTH